MREIHKKTWTPFFEKILVGEKNSDIRLADFNVEEGDVIIFEEWNLDMKYTGRSISRVVDKLFKVNLTDFWTKEEIVEKGVYLIELSSLDRDVKKMSDKWTGKDDDGKPFTVDMLRGHSEIWISLSRGRSHGIFERNIIPRPCYKCGFPVLDIMYKDYEHHQIHLGCPWCNSAMCLCLICGKIAYILPDSCDCHTIEEMMIEAKRK